MSNKDDIVVGEDLHELEDLLESMISLGIVTKTEVEFETGDAETKYSLTPAAMSQLQACNDKPKEAS